MKKFIIAIGFLSLLAACTTLDVYEKTAFFPKHEWSGSELPSFSFIVEDTTVLYNVLVSFRHEDAYRYNNLWLKVTTRAPGDSARTQQLNLTLANKNGWMGTGMDDIFDHRIRVTGAPVKLKKGTYTFTLQQDMREDPLQYVLNAGIRVEKAVP